MRPSPRHRIPCSPAARRICVALSLLGAGCQDTVPLVWKHVGDAANPTAALATAGFVAYGHDAGVTVLSGEGEPQCEFDAHGSVVAPPRTDGRHLFFGSTNHIVYAIDASCKFVWKYTTGDGIVAAAQVARNVVYVPSLDGHIYALEAGTGALRWAFPPLATTHVEGMASAMPQPPPAVAAEVPAKGRGGKKGKGKGRVKNNRDRLQHAQARRHVPKPTATLSSMPAPTPVPAVAPPVIGAFAGASPVVANGLVYAPNTDGFVYVLDANDGALKWRFGSDGALRGGPLVVDGSLYFGGSDGDIYAVNARTHELLWKVPTLDAVQSTPRLADHVLYVGANDHHVYALDPAKGQIRWKFETRGPVVAAPVIYKGLVVAGGGAADGAVYAIRRTDQSVFWKFQTAGEINQDLTMLDDRLFVPSSDGTLACFRLAEAPQQSY